MSFLTPLYILGALAIAAPFVFHLIRRTTRGEVPFSSLIFLSPSPPRLTRRSRIDHWFLLLLRSIALVLLALAFARPFVRQVAALGLGDAAQRRVAILIDTSASMRRGDLFARAKAKAVEAIENSRPGDQLAVYAFDSTTKPVLSFAESVSLDPGRRKETAKALVERLATGWGSTQLGQALIDAAGAIEDLGDSAQKASRLERRIVLISDLQRGSRLDVLGDFEWPTDVVLELKTVAVEGSNAGLQWLGGSEAGAPFAGDGAKDVRVRVSNDARSRTESFELAWAGDRNPPVATYVPPGESRVVRVTLPTGLTTGQSLRLRGDTQDFDNTLYRASESREKATVVYVGRDTTDDPTGLLFYLERAFTGTPAPGVEVVPRSPSVAIAVEPSTSVPLIVVASEVSTENVEFLRQFANDGGTVLAVVTSASMAPTLSALLNVPSLALEESPSGADAMLQEIVFDHPLFAPFAAPQFNDFTKIRFWKHRRIPTDHLGDARVLARFEERDPALIEHGVGKGRIVLLASGWSPTDSQLARSSKFVPLLQALLEGPAAGSRLSVNLLVHERLEIPEGTTAVRRPDGSSVRFAPGDRGFTETDEPGLYVVETSKGPREIAVNLDPAESRTAPLEVEVLEQFGCRFAKSASQVEAERDSMRQMQNAELEGRQKLWRPLILAVIAVLIVETWVAGRLGRPRPNRAEAPVT